ncbi:MAG: non-canonical purine NTP diphosphatase [Saprospiraceae bacterium]|mgnify:CR=1 FL=1
MKNLVFATSNPNKIKEANDLLPTALEVKGLKDIGCTEEVPETSPTIQGNALQKARYVFENYKVNCFSEDTGLEIDALDGEPGVYTARYAGEARDKEANMAKAIANLEGKSDRGAQFRTVIALIIDGKEYTFEGIARGTIAHQKQGTEGFGYDPIFIPAGYKTSFAQMTQAEKNEISHRGQAVRKLVAFLDTL